MLIFNTGKVKDVNWKMHVKIKKLKSSVFPKLKFEKTSNKLEEEDKQYLLNLLRFYI